MEQMEGYLVTALIAVAAVPVFGMIMGLVRNMAYMVIGMILGSKTAFYLFNYMTFPGVMHHELSHALFAFLTGGKITELALFRPKGDTLGHVTWSPRGGLIRKALQSTFCSVGPVVCGTASSLFLYVFLTDRWESLVWWQAAILIYLLVSIILHMTMSRQDVEVMFSGIGIVYILIAVCFTVFHVTLFEQGLDIGGLIAKYFS